MTSYFKSVGYCVTCALEKRTISNQNKVLMQVAFEKRMYITFANTGMENKKVYGHFFLLNFYKEFKHKKKINFRCLKSFLKWDKTEQNSHTHTYMNLNSLQFFGLPLLYYYNRNHLICNPLLSFDFQIDQFIILVYFIPR